MPEIEERCRLVLIAPAFQSPQDAAQAIANALSGGDVATVILPQYGFDETAFQAIAEAAIPLIQQAGTAAIIAGDSRIAGRAKADGLHIDEGAQALGDAMEKFSPRLIIGAGKIKDRHAALELGERRPDYVFFGKLDGDIKAEPHAKTLALCEWWAGLVEIACIGMGGNSIASALDVAETGAEFVALRGAVFDDPRGPALAVAEINALLAENAPRLA